MIASKEHHPPHTPYRPLRCRSTPTALPARQARSREKRERLLWALECVIREAGMERATVRAIAARARVSVGTVYRRFPNKRALVAALQARVMARRVQRAALSARLGQRAPRRRKLARLVNGALLEVERDRPLLWAFAPASCPERALYAALRPLMPRPATVGLGLDLLFLVLRGLLMHPEAASARPHSRALLAEGLLGLIAPR
jgi:AcrR family transcriptional regulator